MQYHLIVNDWQGRIAWYLRSKDGINWKVDPGEVYLPGIATYEDGTSEAVPKLNPYEKTIIDLSCGDILKDGKEYEFKVIIEP